MKRELAKRDAIDLWEGTRILGCGGGGNPSEGLGLVEHTYGTGRAFQLCSVNDLPADALIVTVGLVGGGVTDDELEQVLPFPRQENAVLRAIESLEEHLGREIEAYMPCEPGAGNSFVPLYAAAMKGAVTVDLDTAGRAKPEITNSTTSIFGVPLTPLAVATDYGDVVLLTEAVDERRVEQICRYIARASGGMCAVARCPIPASEAPSVLISGSLEKSLAAGRAIRDSSDPVGALIRALDASRVFEGIVQDYSRREEGGFMWGEIRIAGENAFAGKAYRIFFKNENLIGWKDGTVDVTAPDLLAMVDASTGEGIYNWTDGSLRVGRSVTLIRAEADPHWLTPRGLELFGPRHFGYDFDYRPYPE